MYVIRNGHIVRLYNIAAIGTIAAVTTPFFSTTNFEVSLLFEQPSYRGNFFFIYFEPFVIQ